MNSTSSPGPHCRNRLFEWAMAGAMFLIGVELLIWPDALVKSKLQFMVDVLGSTTFTIVYLVMGWSRMAALYLNGRQKPWTAYLRALMAVCGACVWSQMGVSLVLTQIAVDGPPSPSVPLYLVIAGVEIYSTYRAMRDAGRR